jgi:hypothetical protein
MKRCRKHEWKIVQAKLRNDLSLTPGSINYAIPSLILIKICLRCDRVVDTKKEERTKWQTK